MYPGINVIQWELVAREFATAANNTTIYARDKDRLERSYKNLPKDRKAELNAVATASLPARVISNTDQEPGTVQPVPEVDASSSNSLAIAHCTTITTSNASQSSTPSIRLKSETAFSEEERKMIKQWGMDKKKSTPPQDVTDRYLFSQHLNYFYNSGKLPYARKGGELKNVWENWWKDNKGKYN